MNKSTLERQQPVPVAYTDKEELGLLVNDKSCADMWKVPHGFGEDIPLYTTAPTHLVIPWASVSESLPEKEDGCLLLPCLVRYVWTYCDGNKHYALGEDFFDNDASELGGEWLENDGAVTHWVYMQDLPMPVEPVEEQSQ